VSISNRDERRRASTDRSVAAMSFDMAVGRRAPIGNAVAGSDKGAGGRAPAKKVRHELGQGRPSWLTS
jgi:hypothetical protein